MRAAPSPLGILTAATLAALTSAQEQAPARAPNSLTPEEIAQGWILLFDGATSFGWSVEGEVGVAQGALVLGGEEPTHAHSTTAFEWSGNHTFSAELEVRWEGEEPPRIQPFGDSIGWLTLNESSRMEWTPQRMTLTKRFSLNPSPPLPLRFEVPAGSVLEVRDIRYRPTSLEPLFNGVDLEGWEAIPGRESQFSVTEERELRIRNGPGDLHSEGQWADFILRLDIRTAGEHLNSGVFFRCQPGEFWSGYESQIRNQWQGEDRSRPVDFGTGGIYGHQPARRVVSSDHQWFTKTIIAQGEHMAVWIDGYQVSDFTDTRRARPSARRGSKRGEGPISLQGHDPTTDLYFRNIKIQAFGERPEDD